MPVKADGICEEEEEEDNTVQTKDQDVRRRYGR